MKTSNALNRTSNLLPTASRPLASVCLATGMIVTSLWANHSIAIAGHPEPINRAGRVVGAGWSDGYHACETSGLRLRADLPPTSYANRLDVTLMRLAANRQRSTVANGTFYDQFDQACDQASSLPVFAATPPGVADWGYCPPQPSIAPTPTPTPTPPGTRLDERESRGLEQDNDKDKGKDRADKKSLPQRKSRESAHESSSKSFEELPAPKTQADDEDLLAPSPSDSLDSSSQRSTLTPHPIVLSELLTPKVNPTRLPKTVEPPNFDTQPDPSARVATAESLIIRQPK